MRGKVVAELVSDERVVALFAGRRLLRIGCDPELNSTTKLVNIFNCMCAKCLYN